MYRKLSDRPRVIKQKLEKEISVLENYKRQLDNKFSNSLISLQRSMNSDKLQSDIDLSTKLYKIVGAELADQLQLAKTGYSSISQLTQDETEKQLQELTGMNTSGFTPPLSTDLQSLGNVISEYRQYRFSDDSISRGKKLQLLLQILKNLPTAVDSCESCLKKFNVQFDNYVKKDIEQLQPHLHQRYLELIKNAGTNKSEINEIAQCYNKLVLERNKCLRGGPLSAGISNMSRPGAGAIHLLGNLNTAAQIVAENYDMKKQQQYTVPPSISVSQTTSS